MERKPQTVKSIPIVFVFQYLKIAVLYYL